MLAQVRGQNIFYHSWDHAKSPDFKIIQKLVVKYKCDQFQPVITKTEDSAVFVSDIELNQFDVILLTKLIEEKDEQVIKFEPFA